MSEKAIALLREADSIEVFSGAGVSAESGLGTYRDEDTGLWHKVDPTTYVDIANWDRESDKMWAFAVNRLRSYIDAEPNAGHLAIARLAEHRDVHVSTQNVDNLHERGGMDPKKVAHLHGNALAFRCFDCRRPYPTPEPPDPPVEKLAPPRCEHCRGKIRPDTVWFGEALPQDEWQEAERRMHQVDALLIVGTSGVVYPAAALPLIAQERGIPIIEITPQPTELTPVADVSLTGTAGEVLPELVRGLR